MHPQISEWREKYWQEDLVEVQRTYFSLLAKAAESRLFDSLAHPDLIKNFTATAWDPLKIMPDICRSLDRIAKTGITMELNTSGVNKTIQEMNPMPSMLREIAKRKTLSRSGRMHIPDRVADGFEKHCLVARCWFRAGQLLSNRKRYEIPIVDALASLNRESQCRDRAPFMMRRHDRWFGDWVDLATFRRDGSQTRNPTALRDPGVRCVDDKYHREPVSGSDASG